MQWVNASGVQRVISKLNQTDSIKQKWKWNIHVNLFIYWHPPVRHSLTSTTHPTGFSLLQYIRLCLHFSLLWWLLMASVQIWLYNIPFRIFPGSPSTRKGGIWCPVRVLSPDFGSLWHLVAIACTIAWRPPVHYWVVFLHTQMMFCISATHPTSESRKTTVF